MRLNLPVPFAKLFFVSATLVFAPVVVHAHTGHEKKQTPAAPQTQTAVMPGSVPAQNVQKPPEPVSQPEVEPQRDKETIIKEAVSSHLHNKIIHFPLALGFAGAVLILLSYRWPQYRSAARLLLAVAAVSAVAAYFTGRAQEEPFEKGEMEPFLGAHKNLGTATAVALWIGVFLTGFSQYKKLLVFYAIILLLLISATGFFGGILAHG